MPRRAYDSAIPGSTLLDDAEGAIEMRMGLYRVAVAGVLVVMIAPPAMAAEGSWNPAASKPVCTTSHDQEHPAISSAKQGLIVVWQDSRPDGKKEGTKFPYSVYAKFLKYRKEVVVFSPPDANAMTPAISGTRVVFAHYRGWSNVMKVELPRGTPEVIGDIAFLPAIDGDLIVFESACHRWEGWTGKGAPSLSWVLDILAYDVGGVELTFDVTNSDIANQQNPDVSGSTIVWQRGTSVGGWNNHGICKRDINADPEPVRICGTAGKSARNPVICAEVIVWQDNRNGNWDIYAYDMEAGAELEICLAPGDQEAPAIDGETIVWQDKRGDDWDIHGYDLNAKSAFAVYEGKGDQTEPDVHGDVVVWTDNRNGNKDIYMSRRTRE